MAEKKECPYNLREMYEVQRLSQAEIATREATSITTVRRWMRERGIKTHHSSRFTFPVDDRPSREWLWEKYWRLGMTSAEIGRLWADAIQRQQPFADKTVRKWMRRHDISIRNKREANQTPPSLLFFEKGREARKGYPSGRPRHEMLKIAKISARVRRKENYQTRECSLPGCGVAITRTKSKFTRENCFCCGSHRATYYHTMNRQRKHDAILERMQQEAEASLLKAQQEARDKLARGY